MRVSSSQTTKFIKAYVPNAQLVCETKYEVSYILPDKGKSNKEILKGLFSSLQERKKELGFDSFGLQDTTLEEVVVADLTLLFSYFIVFPPRQDFSRASFFDWSRHSSNLTYEPQRRRFNFQLRRHSSNLTQRTSKGGESTCRQNCNLTQRTSEGEGQLASTVVTWHNEPPREASQLAGKIVTWHKEPPRGRANLQAQ